MVKMSNLELFKWLVEEIDLRKKLAKHSCEGNEKIAYDNGASETILIYDSSVFKKLAKECVGGAFTCEELDKPTTSVLTHRAYFTYLDLEVDTYIHGEDELKRLYE